MNAQEMWKTPIGKIRLLGMTEGASFLLLLLVAMPLKYFAGLPLFVRVVGSAHGVLFVWFGYELLAGTAEKHLRLGQALKVFLASLVPFGPFLIDGWLRRLGEERPLAP